jgi:hypothetical protein
MVEVGKQKSRCEHGRVFGWEWASFLESFEVNDEPCEMKRGNVQDKIESTWLFEAKPSRDSAQKQARFAVAAVAIWQGMPLETEQG